MNINQAFSGITADIYPPENKNAFLSTEMLFKGDNQARKSQVIKNQQINDYHMYRNKLPWELNRNAGDMFNGHNSQIRDNEYLSPQYHQQFNLSPSYYDEKNYGSFDTHYQMPTPLDNDKMYQYHTADGNQGLPHVYDIRMKESRNYKQKRSFRSDDDFAQQNQSLQHHFFTPMTSMGYRHNQDPMDYQGHF